MAYHRPLQEAAEAKDLLLEASECACPVVQVGELLLPRIKRLSERKWPQIVPARGCSKNMWPWHFRI